MSENYNKNMEVGRPFYGRNTELDRLDRAYRSARSELWVVYGRRRVGKTELLRTFARDKRAFFFTAGREPARAQIRRFLSQLASFTGDPLLGKVQSATWSEAMSLLTRTTQHRADKTLVVLDEFQWMCRGTSSVLSDIQRMWDHEWRDDGRMFLVLCGSAVSFMLGEVLAQKSPLHGRRTESIHLAPMAASEASGFFGERSSFDVAEALICVGGIPAYLQRFPASASVRSTLNDMAFLRDGYLVDEIDHVLGEQLRRKERYHQICRLLSEEPKSLDEMSRHTGLNKGQLSFYLERLCLLGFVDRHRPINKPSSSKTVRHRLYDEYLRFYFRYISPNLERIRLQTEGYHLDRMTHGHWDVFLGLGFELFVRRNLDALVRALGIRDTISVVGSYWHRATQRRSGVQIDLVIERLDGVTNIVECKWSRSSIGTNIVRELKRKCDLYPNPRRHTLEPVLVAAAGSNRTVTDAGIRVIALEDLVSPGS